MNLLSSLLAEDVDMNFEYVASVVITGLTVVFLCLIILVIILFLFGLVSKAQRRYNEKSAESNRTEKTTVDIAIPKVQEVKTVPDVEDGIEEEIVAVITAAIVQVSEKSGKRLALKSIKTAKPQRTAWAAAGLIDNTRPF